MLHQPARFAFVAPFAVASCTAVRRDQTAPPAIEVLPRVATDSVKIDADDPAIWIHPTDHAKSVIIGTDKNEDGGLYVWDLHGKQIQYVPLWRPNNVDVRYGMKVGDRMIDLAVTNLRRLQKGKNVIRGSREIKVFEINPTDGTLTDITTAEGIKTPELDEPYGLCLYRRPADGAIFVIESSKDGESAKSLHQYRLIPDGFGKVKGIYVRSFGKDTIIDQVEGLVADDELGFIYAADEKAAIRKYYADPDKGDNNEIVAFALDDGIQGDREGLAIYRCDSATGYLLLSNQVGGEFSSVKVYRREGDEGKPHQHRLLATVNTRGSAETDGLDVTSRPASPEFPHGFLVKHDSPGRCFKLYAWEDIVKSYPLIGTSKTMSTK